jgi:hypothetical protein
MSSSSIIRYKPLNRLTPKKSYICLAGLIILLSRNRTSTGQPISSMRSAQTDFDIGLLRPRAYLKKQSMERYSLELCGNESRKAIAGNSDIFLILLRFWVGPAYPARFKFRWRWQFLWWLIPALVVGLESFSSV